MSTRIDNWRLYRFGDVAKFVNGRAYSQHEMLATGTPLLRIQNLNGGKNWFYSDLELSPEKYCEAGDLLYAWSATFGPYWWCGPRAIFHYHIWNVKPSGAIDQRFAFYELLRVTNDIRRAAHGVAMPHITKGGMEAWEIRLPEIREQRRIADKLDAVLARVDACRERLDRVPAILKRFRQSVLAAASSGALTEDIRPAGDGIDDVPSGWTSTNIGSVAEDLRYGTSKKCEYSDTGVGVLRIPNIGAHGRIDASDLKRAEFDASEIEKLALQPGDLLVIRSNGSLDLVGKVSMVSASETGLLFAGYLLRLRVDLSRVLPSFLYLCLSEPRQRQRIELTSKSTSGVNNINAEELRGLPVTLPTIDEQGEIVRRVESLFAWADRLEARHAAARAQVERLTPSLLAKAFRGELVPQNPADEPASELLKRVAQRPPANPTVPVKRQGAKPRGASASQAASNVREESSS